MAFLRGLLLGKLAAVSWEGIVILRTRSEEERDTYVCYPKGLSFAHFIQAILQEALKSFLCE